MDGLDYVEEVVDRWVGQHIMEKSDKLALAHSIWGLPINEALQKLKEAVETDRQPLVIRPTVSQALSTVGSPVGPDGMITVPEEETFPMFKLNDMTHKTVESLTNSGYKVISENKLACVCLAGGQGTRMTCDGMVLQTPKGCCNIGLSSNKSLFQLFAERIQRVEDLAAEAVRKERSSVAIPLLVMCSPHNHDDTVAHFESHGYFGLEPSNVIFFVQSVFPYFTEEDKILLSSPTEVATYPNGTGALFEALKRRDTEEKSTVLEQIKDRGIQFLHVFGVDNIMAKCADPLFIGLCAACGVPAGIKCCSQAGNNARDVQAHPNSEILYLSDGSICNHFITLDFIENHIRHEHLKYNVTHRALVPYYDLDLKISVVPQVRNGVRIECSLSDVLQVAAERVLVFECDRQTDYSVVTNFCGPHSPDTAVDSYRSMCWKWARHAGLTVQSNGAFEITPLGSYAGEGLEPLRGATVQAPTTVDRIGGHLYVILYQQPTSKKRKRIGAQTTSSIISSPAVVGDPSSSTYRDTFWEKHYGGKLQFFCDSSKIFWSKQTVMECVKTGTNLCPIRVQNPETVTSEVVRALGMGIGVKFIEQAKLPGCCASTAADFASGVSYSESLWDYSGILDCKAWYVHSPEKYPEELSATITQAAMYAQGCKQTNVPLLAIKAELIPNSFVYIKYISGIWNGEEFFTESQKYLCLDLTNFMVFWGSMDELLARLMSLSPKPLLCLGPEYSDEVMEDN